VKICKSCKSEFVPRQPLQRACSPVCALKVVKQAQKRASERAYRKETLDRRKSLTTPTEAARPLKRAFNRYIRLRDEAAGLPCVSCGTFELKYGQTWDCGHYLAVGERRELQWSESNSNRQCSGCNRGGELWSIKKNTVREGYRATLIKRLGIKIVEELEGPHPPLKLTVPEIMEMAALYRAKCKELEKELEL